MGSPVSGSTHQPFKSYEPTKAIQFYEFMYDLMCKARAGAKTPYNAEAFVRHASVNRLEVRKLIDTALLRSDALVDIPASIIFWVYRGCTAMELKCPVELPHVCKIPTATGEEFYVTSKIDWIAHREATISISKSIQVSDHAKLQYLDRVLGIDVPGLLESFPVESLTGEYKLLEDGRKEFIVGEFAFVMDGDTCVTVLKSGMVAS